MTGLASPTREKSLHTAGFLACSISGRPALVTGARRPRVLRRMRFSRLGLLFAVALLPLALWGALPVSQTARRARARRRSARRSSRSARDRAEEEPRARALHDGRALQPPDRRAAVRHHRAAARQSASRATSTPSARSSRASRRPAPERIRLARLRARLAEARVALADRLVELYKADKPDVVTVCSSPTASPTCSTARSSSARLRPGPRIIDRVRRRKRRPKMTDGTARRARGAADQGRRRDRGAPRRGLARPRPARRPPRPVRRRALRQGAPRSPARATAASTSRATSRRSRPPDAKIQAAARRGAERHPVGQRGARAPRLRRPDLARQRPDRLALRHALGAPARRASTSPVPSGTPVRASEAGRSRSPAGWAATATTPASATAAGCRPVTATSRLGDLGRRPRVPGPGHRLPRAAPATASAPHVHFETRINGAPVNPAGYL